METGCIVNGTTPPIPTITGRTSVKRRSRLNSRETAWFYLCIAPWLVGFFVFTFGPILASIALSFTDWDLFQRANFVGVSNYDKLLTQDDIFWKSIYNTFFYTFISIPVAMALSLVIAYMLNKNLQGINLFRTLYYLPSTVPVVASSFLFIWLFAPQTGLINTFLQLFSIEGPSWLMDAAWVKPSLIIMSLWSVGGGVVLLLAGMKGIPMEMYESAAIDGASRWKEFFYITLPMLSPVIFFTLVTGVISHFQTFAQIYIMTSGGPDNASMMIVPFLFDHAFRFYHMGYASAIAWLLFLIILAFTLLIFRSSALWVYYEEGRNNE